MAVKPYAWTEGAPLDDHTRRKHKILREYFFKYIAVRCQIPQQRKFRLAVVDGFSGAGRYACGSAGSPIIFLEELWRSLDAVNLARLNQGLGRVEIECLLILNDASPDAVALLQNHCAPVVAEIKASCPQLHLSVEYMTGDFEKSYPKIKALIAAGRFRNVLFNLDQCGYSKVEHATLIEIMRSTAAVEVFYTFAIESLLAFLSRTNKRLMAGQLKHLGIDGTNLSAVEMAMSNAEWLGAAEKLVFETHKVCAPYASPFSIQNPEGWRYWLIHFANKVRARQVYNNVLHDNSTSQAHFGRAGLDMLSYDPSHDGSLYLFDVSGRAAARDQLHDDIPRLLMELGDAISVGEFYENVYNMTPSHMDDVHAAMIGNPDLEVITPSGGTRRAASMISSDDVLRLKPQRSLFPMFSLPLRKK